MSFIIDEDWSVGSEYAYGPYIGLPSNAQPTIGECNNPLSLSFIKPAVFSNKLSPRIYLSVCGLLKCAYSPPYWFLYPSNTEPFAASYVVVLCKL